MLNFRPSPTHISNIITVGHMIPGICSGQKTIDGGRRTDIWITKSLPELSSGETKRALNNHYRTIYDLHNLLWFYTYPFRIQKRGIQILDHRPWKEMIRPLFFLRVYQSVSSYEGGSKIPCNHLFWVHGCIYKKCGSIYIKYEPLSFMTCNMNSIARLVALRH